MKKLGFRWITALAAGVMLLGAVSCSDDKTETIYITNPSFQDLAVKPGDTGSITFTAPSIWTISNDSPEWLTLGASTGAAGAQKVTYTVTDTGQAFDQEDKAKITLINDAGTYTCTITRSSKVRVMQFFDQIDATQQISFITIADNGFSEFKGRLIMKPNFDWKFKSCPDWLTPRLIGSEDPEISGLADVDATMFFDIKADQITTTGKDGLVVFTDPSGKFEVSIPIKFFGAEPMAVVVELTAETHFSNDGHVYDLTWTKVTDQTTTPFSVQAVDGNYKLMAFGKVYSFGQMTTDNSWIKWEEAPAARATINKKNFNLSLTGEAPLSKREGYFVVLPAQVYAQLMETPDADLAEAMFEIKKDGYTFVSAAPKGDYAQYVYKMVQDGKPSIKFESADIAIEDITTTAGTEFPVFGMNVPKEGKTITATVTLPEAQAGMLPVLANGDPNATITLPLSYEAWYPEHVVGVSGNATITIKNYSTTATSYSMMIVVPANTTGHFASGWLDFKAKPQDENPFTSMVINSLEVDPAPAAR
ncbi:MAG: hypothetical protein RR199_05710 [Alistipes sp.]